MQMTAAAGHVDPVQRVPVAGLGVIHIMLVLQPFKMQELRSQDLRSRPGMLSAV